ncbi:hypothetical protein LEP1GSC173_3766 [Leptospira interrogans str. HAI1594]|uniref:Uncharacterized protein n=1 Tax=Leptospira interrogans serovar Copenhageni str. LT2050 TaxID=1001598 RepID=M3H7R8_LEPIT|nr:hypothetical protein LEP1GSC080_4240 [Leptospira interrogans str. FPW2026]EKP21415.1 hypothetical protein LEP1GSC117_0881 [Leptospira interrogans serovar Icterohaemorrhagiae str. Verdun LP]EKP74206.1 hypothetical protein LEP1GSC173_3766 [Leptospira interrogans str. HAI1594]EMG20404.1 hypothetical protein LEP1GSC150_5064 [Leptospira interrogans serovar Copenhageni str. LT2050]EMN70378.1 hypothetical protein LEP1GSC100_2036 [Leptospira interrogans serovar Bataviae str. UI 08561]EMO18266.1 hyp
MVLKFRNYNQTSLRNLLFFILKSRSFQNAGTHTENKPQRR